MRTAFSSASSSASTAKAAAAAGSGGSLTDLLNAGYEGAWPTGLDPATNTNGAANQSLMNAIYGNLFELGPKGKIINDLATGYSFQDGGKTVTIDLRTGVKFSNGDPFNAEMVAATIRTSTFTVSVEPSGMNSRSCMTRSNFVCVSSEIVPISSKKIVPRSAVSK